LRGLEVVVKWLNYGEQRLRCFYDKGHNGGRVFGASRRSGPPRARCDIVNHDLTIAWGWREIAREYCDDAAGC